MNYKKCNWFVSNMIWVIKFHYFTRSFWLVEAYLAYKSKILIPNYQITKESFSSHTNPTFSRLLFMLHVSVYSHPRSCDVHCTTSKKTSFDWQCAIGACFIFYISINSPRAFPKWNMFVGASCALWAPQIANWRLVSSL